MPPTFVQRGPAKRNDNSWTTTLKTDTENLPHVSSRLDVLGALTNSAELALQDKGGLSYLRFKAGSSGEETSGKKQLDIDQVINRCSIEQKVRNKRTMLYILPHTSKTPHALPPLPPLVKLTHPFPALRTNAPFPTINSYHSQ